MDELVVVTVIEVTVRMAPVAVIRVLTDSLAICTTELASAGTTLCGERARRYVERAKGV